MNVIIKLIEWLFLRSHRNPATLCFLFFGDVSGFVHISGTTTFRRSCFLENPCTEPTEADWLDVFTESSSCFSLWRIRDELLFYFNWEITRYFQQAQLVRCIKESITLWEWWVLSEQKHQMRFHRSVGAAVSPHPELLFPAQSVTWFLTGRDFSSRENGRHKVLIVSLPSSVPSAWREEKRQSGKRKRWRWKGKAGREEEGRERKSWKKGDYTNERRKRRQRRRYMRRGWAARERKADRRKTKDAYLCSAFQQDGNSKGLMWKRLRERRDKTYTARRDWQSL